jgi:glycine cleavage system H protein
MAYPKDARYTKEHEWIRAEGATATVGITDFAQGQLGDIVYIELPEVGRVVSQGEVVGTIESVKAVSEIYAPVSGEVIEVNGGLNETPETVNKDPHGAAWLYRVRLTQPGEMDALMDAAAYEALTAA